MPIPCWPSFLLDPPPLAAPPPRGGPPIYCPLLTFFRLAPAQDVAAGGAGLAVFLQGQCVDPFRDVGRLCQAQQHDVLVVGGRIEARVDHSLGHRNALCTLRTPTVVLSQADMELPGEMMGWVSPGALGYSAGFREGWAS